MLSQKAKYGLKAVLALAELGEGRMMLISDIAQQQNVPSKFLELILLELKRHGLVHSQRGKNGGYALSRPPEQITFGQIVRILDGPLAPLPCASLSGYRRCSDCNDEDTCAVRLVMRQVRNAVAEILDSTSLADVSGSKRADLANILATM
jgi:Rrf2 family protein